MNAFIVYAHPEPKSFNGALLRRSVEVLRGLGHDVNVSDLYAMKFDPVSDRRNFIGGKDPGTNSYLQTAIEKCQFPKPNQ